MLDDVQARISACTASMGLCFLCAWIDLWTFFRIALVQLLHFQSKLLLSGEENRHLRQSFKALEEQRGIVLLQASSS